MLKRKINFPIGDDPMDGIFSYMRKRNELNYVLAYEHYKYENPQNSDAIDLIKNDTKVWYSSLGNLNEYFEFAILNYELYITGYGLMGYYNDDNIPRNWKIICSEGSEEKIISHEVDNNKLCNGINGLYNKCGTSDKKAFEAQNPMKCNRIKYQISGFDSSHGYFIVLSGFELFGYITYNICTFVQKHMLINFTQFIYILILF